VQRNLRGIDAAYRASCTGANCTGVQINIMDIPKVFAFGRQKIAEGEDDQARFDQTR
jgi:hypothetical protein